MPVNWSAGDLGGFVPALEVAKTAAGQAAVFTCTRWQVEGKSAHEQAPPAADAQETCFFGLLVVTIFVVVASNIIRRLENCVASGSPGEAGTLNGKRQTAPNARLDTKHQPSSQHRTIYRRSLDPGSGSTNDSASSSATDESASSSSSRRPRPGEKKRPFAALPRWPLTSTSIFLSVAGQRNIASASHLSAQRTTAGSPSIRTDEASSARAASGRRSSHRQSQLGQALHQQGSIKGTVPVAGFQHCVACARSFHKCD